MRVAFLPSWPTNPYHRELIAALQKVDCEVACPPSLKELYAGCTSRERTPDVIHLHALPYFGRSLVSAARFFRFYSRLRSLKRRGVRLVWTVHDFHNHDTKARRIEETSARWLSRNIDAFIVHGKAAKEIIVQRWGPSMAPRIFVIPHGHYMDSYPNVTDRVKARATLGLSDNQMTFLFLGLIRPYKGVPEMVAAFKALPDPQARLVIAGRPINTAISREIEDAARDEPRITFIPGHVEDGDVQTYMNAADIIVLPYKRVFTSGAAVLAMSFGKPCIAPRAGCVTDTLDERGAVFFDPAVDGDLDTAFGTVSARRGQLKDMGAYNQSRARGWDWDSIGRETARIYRG